MKQKLFVMLVVGLVQVPVLAESVAQLKQVCLQSDTGMLEVDCIAQNKTLEVNCGELLNEFSSEINICSLDNSEYVGGSKGGPGKSEKRKETCKEKKERLNQERVTVLDAIRTAKETGAKSLLADLREDFDDIREEIGDTRIKCAPKKSKPVFCRDYESKAQRQRCRQAARMVRNYRPYQRVESAGSRRVIHSPKTKIKVKVVEPKKEEKQTQSKGKF